MAVLKRYNTTTQQWEKVGPPVNNGAYVPLVSVGADNGVASLDGSGQVPLSQLGNVPSGGGGLSRTVTTVAYAAAITPEVTANSDLVLNIGALAGDLALAVPGGAPVDGQRMWMRLQQDAAGGHKVTADTASVDGYAIGTDVTLNLVPTGANAKFELAWEWAAADAKWRLVGIVRGF